MKRGMLFAKTWVRQYTQQGGKQIQPAAPVNTSSAVEEKAIKTSVLLGFAAGASIMAWAAYNFFQGSRNTANFASTKAKILKHYDFTILSANLFQSAQWAYVHYEFTTEDGRKFDSHRIVSGSPLRYMERVPWYSKIPNLNKKHVTVMYNPSNPSDCFILHHPCKLQNLFVALLGLSTSMMFYAAKGKL